MGRVMIWKGVEGFKGVETENVAECVLTRESEMRVEKKLLGPQDMRVQEDMSHELEHRELLGWRTLSQYGLGRFVSVLCGDQFWRWGINKPAIPSRGGEWLERFVRILAVYVWEIWGTNGYSMLKEWSQQFET